jgi:DNA polymerase III delta prime subunit
MSVELFVEKYRPQTMDEYVWQDPAMRQKADEWIASGALPHILLSGQSGAGKTSLAKLLLKMLKIPEGDILTIYASRERKIDEVQDRIVNFASTWSLNETGIKYVLLDEADSMSMLAQKFLRSEMETYEASCRFILTCNFPQKILPAIHSRCQEIKFSALDKDDFIARVGEIIVKEDIAFEVEDLLGYVDLTYPDLRKCIGLVQKQTLAKKLLPVPSTEEQTNGKDYLIEMVNLFKAKRFVEARNLIVSQAQVEEYTDIFRYFYRNLELWGSTQDQQDEALLVIRRGLVNHAIISDPEINLSATLVELTHISR